jgi:hypothetical protein
MVRFLVISEASQPWQVDLNIAYCPALACFNIEYWLLMCVEEVKEDLKAHMKQRMLKGYMQNLRDAITDAIIAAKPEELQDGSWNMHVAHEWAVRTWNHCRHTMGGRQQYHLECTKRGVTPYAQQLHFQGERCENIWLIPKLTM